MHSRREYIAARAKLVLAQVLLETDRLEDVSAILDETAGQFHLTAGKHHIRIAERYAILGELHLRLREYETAEYISARCEEMRRELLDKDHWAILEARVLRQRAQIGLGNAASAETELRDIAEAVKERLGSDHPLAIRVASARVDCARALGDDALAAVRAERLARLEQRRAERLRDSEESSPTGPGGASKPGQHP